MARSAPIDPNIHDLENAMLQGGNKASAALDWQASEHLAAGKGATVQAFVAALGADRFEIEVAPWGEGHLRLNGREIGHVSHGKDRRQAFRDLRSMADQYLKERAAGGDAKPTIPAAKAALLAGKVGLVVGIANDQSIAWGCARAFRAFGAELAITYLNDKAKKYVEPLARAVNAPILMPLDVQQPGQM
ncbi:MAG TPA: SDR family oxidoreductase, partial [Pirellulales bacterium]|nr:SDR family oxidoreductase [Pirellulales bacterium]